MLVAKLPQDSWTQTELRDAAGEAPPPDPERFGPWALEHYLLAGLTDAVNALTHVFTVANSDPKKARLTPLPPVPRPGIKGRKARKRLTEAAVAYLDGLRAKG